MMQEDVSTENSRGGANGEILLSVCIAGRNDDYGGNFRYRIQTALNHLSKNIRELGLSDLAEVVVTDWNSGQKLGEAIALCPEARQIVRFVYVPPEVAEPLNPVNTRFNNTLSVNAAVRRAKGRFIMYMPGDILFSRASLKNLIDLLQGNATVPIDVDRSLMQIHRKFIPWQFLADEPDIEEIDNYLLFNSWKFRLEIFDTGLNSGMGAYVMSRRLFHECRGINEELSKWGWSDVDLGLRINQKYASIVLSHLGVYCYEMDIKSENREQNIQEQNAKVICKSIEANTPDWGMAGHELEIYAPADRPPPPNTRKIGIAKAELFRDMRHSPVRQMIAEAFGEGTLSSSSWPSMFMLAWYTHVFRPRSFVDFAFLAGLPSAVVPFMNPCITCIGIDGCEDPSSGLHLVSVISLLDNKLGFKGRIHFLSGEIDSAFKRLCESAKVCDRYGLIHFIPDLFPDTYLAQLEYILDNTSDPGAIVLTTGRPEYLRVIDGRVKERWGECLFVKSVRLGCGMIMKNGDKDLSRGRDADFEEDTEAAYLESIVRCSIN